eukprot:SAG31_NODE_3088_length_4690_cov_2.363973_8_plen_59_part_00
MIAAEYYKINTDRQTSGRDLCYSSSRYLLFERLLKYHSLEIGPDPEKISEFSFYCTFY